MPTVHAYRRKKPHTPEVGGVLYKFAANEAGEQVCEVPEGPGLDRLLEIAEGYKLHGVQKDKADDEPNGDVSPYILTQEGEGGEEVSIDLRTLDKAALVKFCADNEIPAPHPNAKEETIRNKIVEFFKVE